MFARDLQNVLLTGKTQKALKSEEIVQQALLSEKSKQAHICAEIGRKALYHMVSMQPIRELSGTVGKCQF